MQECFKAAANISGGSHASAYTLRDTENALGSKFPVPGNAYCQDERMLEKQKGSCHTKLTTSKCFPLPREHLHEYEQPFSML